MSQPASHVTRMQAAISRMIDAYEGCQAVANEAVALGGPIAVAASPYWDQPGVTPSTPRTDLPITGAQYLAALGALQALETAIGPENASALYAVKV